MTEKQKYKAWVKDQVDNHGLIDLSISVDRSKSPTEEEFYKELNEFNKQLDENKGIEVTFL